MARYNSRRMGMLPPRGSASRRRSRRRWLSIPLVFSYTVAKKFNDVFVTAEPPDVGEMDTILEIGSWTCGVDGAAARHHLLLPALCMQYSRDQRLNMGQQPYTESVQEPARRPAGGRLPARTPPRSSATTPKATAFDHSDCDGIDDMRNDPNATDADIADTGKARSDVGGGRAPRGRGYGYAARCRRHSSRPRLKCARPRPRRSPRTRPRHAPPPGRPLGARGASSALLRRRAPRSRSRRAPAQFLRASATMADDAIAEGASARGEEGDEAAGLLHEAGARRAQDRGRDEGGGDDARRAAHVAARPAQLLRPVHRGDAGAAPPRGVLPGGAGERAEDARAVRDSWCSARATCSPGCTCCSRWARCTSRAGGAVEGHPEGHGRDVPRRAAPDARALPAQLPVADVEGQAARRRLGVRGGGRLDGGGGGVRHLELHRDEQAVGADAAPGAGARAREARARALELRILVGTTSSASRASRA